MTPNYEAEARRKQQEQQQDAYQTQRDPFAYGQQVARRRYSEIMSGLQERQQQTAKSYSDLYQQARQMGVAQRAEGSPSLSGGMQAQYSDLLSTREMQQLGQIGGQREQALGNIELQKQSAFANAQLEGQQAEQFQLQNQQTRLGVIQQKNQILADESITDEQKIEQLNTLGFTDVAEELKQMENITDPKASAGIIGAVSTTIGSIAGLKALIGLGGVFAAAGKATGVAASIAAGASAFPVLAAATAVVAIGIGIDKIQEAQGKEGWLKFI